MTNTNTPSPAAPLTVTSDVVADAVTAEVDDLYRAGWLLLCFDGWVSAFR